MKNKNVIIGLGVVLVVLLAYKKLYCDKKNMSNTNNPTTAVKEQPKEFKTNTDAKGNFTQYYQENGNFYMANVGPLIKTAPQKISKEEFEKAYFAA